MIQGIINFVVLFFAMIAAYAVIKVFFGTIKAIFIHPIDLASNNILTLLFCTIFVLGFYGMTGSMHSLWGLLFLLNLRGVI